MSSSGVSVLRHPAFVVTSSELGFPSISTHLEEETGLIRAEWRPVCRKGEAACGRFKDQVTFSCITSTSGLLLAGLCG